MDKRFAFELSGYERDPRVDYPLVAAMIQGWAGVNRILIERGKVPRLYDSRVLYREDEGEELWRDCVSCYKEGFADCKSLVSWRLAEHMIAGKPCNIGVSWRIFENVQRRRFSIYHVYLITAHGIEDPSLRLGMQPF